MKADASIPDEDKKRLVTELNEAIKTTPPLEHKENVDLVKAHRARSRKRCSSAALSPGPQKRRGQLMQERTAAAAGPPAPPAALIDWPQPGVAV